MKTSKKTLSQLRKEADKWFSLAVRYRDCELVAGEWIGECITCNKRLGLKQGHAGHFMSRRYSITRYDDMNVNLQCPGCNTFNGGEQYKYSRALDDKYGTGTAEGLFKKAHESFKPTRDWYEEIISDAKEQVKFYKNLEP